MATDKDPYDKTQQLQTVDKSGKPIDKRVYNAEAAYQIYWQLKEDFDQLAIERARIKGQQDGNPPFSKSKRKSMGLSWMANVNFRRAKSTVRLNSASIWNMFTSVPSFVNMSLKTRKYKDVQTPSADHGATIARHFTDILREWEDFYYNLRLRIDETLTFGMGTVFWPDEYCWKSETVKTANCLIPSKSKSKPSGCRHAAIRDEIDIVDLYNQVFENEAAAKEAGWNIAEVKKTLVHAYQEGQEQLGEEFQMNEWENTAHMILALDDDIDTQFDGLKVVHLLTQERNGKVSHCIFSDESAPAGKDSKKREFLFKKAERFDKISQVLQNMTIDVGDGYMKSIKGLAYDLFPTDDISNRLTCQVLDGVTLSSGLMLQPQTGEDQSKAAIMRKGPVTVIAPAYQAIQSSFAPPIDRALYALQMVYSIQNNNSGVYQSSLEGMTGQSSTARTAEEVRTEAQNEARHENNQAEWYYIAWDMWLKETLRRFLARGLKEGEDGYIEQEEFYSRCEEDGVPETLMNFNLWKIDAIKAIGLGSPVMAQNHTNFLLSMGASLDSRGRKNAIRDSIMVRMGPDKVDRYAPLNSRDDVTTSAHSWAALEVNDFNEGQDVPAGEDDPHIIHVQVHLQQAGVYIQQYQQKDPNFNIQQAMAFFMKAMPHIEQHVRYMLANPMTENAGKQLLETLKQVNAIVQRIAADYQKIIQEQNRAREEQAKMLEEAEQKAKEAEFNVEIEKIRSKERVDMMEAQSLHQSRMAKLEASVQSKIQEAMATIERENMKALAEIDRKQMELEAKINQQGE